MKNPLFVTLSSKKGSGCSSFSARAKRWVTLGTLVVAASGCVSARMSDREADRLFQNGKYEESAAKLREGLEKQGPDGRDRLLYLLDLGLALHTAGKYEDSNKVLLEADKLAEIKDYTSLATESATLLTSENIKDYKAEDFENVLISTYLSLNYAMLGQYEDALVEARRVNRKLSLMVSDGQRKYKQNAFARYLSAIIYEAEGNYNDAYVDYREAWKLEPSFPLIGRDLWRMALVLHEPDEMERWDAEFKLSQEDHVLAKALLPKAGKGEIIVIYQNGISPMKRPNPNFRTIPSFYPRFNPVQYATIELDGQPNGPTHVLHDVQSTAIENLNEKYSAIVAKKIGGVVAKEVVADQLERKTGSPLVGFISRVVMYASDQADLRSWNLLPHDLQIARIPVEPGTHTLKALPMGAPALSERTVQVAAGKKVFVNFRYMP